MDDEQLIECVRKYPVLYDLSNPEYMSSAYKNEIWTKIGEEIQKDGPTCKSRWNNIRDTFRKSLKRNKTKSGQSSKKIKLYKYSDQLNFLREYFGERETKGNFDCEQYCLSELAETVKTENTHTEAYTDDKTTESGSFQRPPSSLNIVENSTIKNKNERESSNQTAASSQEIEIGSESIQSPLSTVNFFDNSTIRKKKKKPLAESSNKRAVSTLMQYLIEQKEASSSIQIEQHPVDLFLSGIAPALKALSPYQWHLAKSELFTIVQKYEAATFM